MWLLNKQFADYAFGTPHFQNLQASNVIQAENKLRGSGDWTITKPASNHEIEGFASVTSAKPWEAISFYLNSNLSDAEHLKTKIDIYRMGWYEGKGGRLIHKRRCHRRQTAFVPHVHRWTVHDRMPVVTNPTRSRFPQNGLAVSTSPS